jgi:hypothetical protein
LAGARLSAITSVMMTSPRAARALLIGLAIALAFSGAAKAGALGACIWTKLSPAEQTRVLGAYERDMGAGAAALQKLDGKLKPKAAACARRADVSSDWIQTIAGSEAVQVWAAAALHLERSKLDAAWAAAPPDVAACVRANGRLAFFSNGLGCANPASSNWLVRRIGVAANQQPAARQALYYFNAKAIGEWGDQLVAKLAAKPR